ncbi:hypothetical protein WX72_03754 [Clostridium autoethanogenum]|nr:hypothetical protein WX72_03754 [Clostridium autoethanogenum]
MKKTKKIKLSWNVSKVNDTSRISAMYCFKSCSENKN